MKEKERAREGAQAGEPLSGGGGRQGRTQGKDDRVTETKASQGARRPSWKAQPHHSGEHTEPSEKKGSGEDTPRLPPSLKKTMSL